ncbi:unnamed protein product [Phytophthora fragariaefolia]|uniref:Vacuolar protein 8 n=1 Tax=Phytophthora fragariaefolia TaxID=1490495 RepID=A0A9W6WZE1_9STRA|nr:unnamed protein product [Phytophthora fragariaefolia]
MQEQLGQELPSVVNEPKGTSESKTVIGRAGSIRGGVMTPQDRRLSRRVSGNLSRRRSRPNSGGSNRKTSSMSMKSVTELAEEEKPSSPTVLRLRALAHAVRARHSLGIQKPAQRKYLLQASEAGTEETDVGVDLLMAGIQTKLKEDAAGGFYNRRRSISNNHYDTDTNQQNLSVSPKSKVRFSNDEQSTENVGRNAPSASPNGKPPLNPSFKSATMKRGSLTMKAPLQRVNTIRGDLSSFMTPYEPRSRQTEVNLDHTQNFGARITCAHSLYKLSCQVGSELAIIGGGAIAQIADFSDVEDSKLLRYSATVLVNVTTDQSALEDFASKDGVSALLELSWTPLIDVKVACTTALCRLSQSRARAAVLVRCRAITELLSMLTVPHVPLQQLVVSCIANLVFYGHSFPDRVFVGDPQAVQSPLGIMNIISQMSASPSTSQFSVEALFNLSLYRSSCLGVLRGGGAETLHTLVSQLCKLVDGNGGGSSSRFLLSLGVQPPGWTADMNICMRLLRLAADTLANFSAHVEYHSLMGSHGIKALSLMLSGALRDVGNFNSSVTTEERFRCTSIPCSRALANFSSNTDLRRQNFPQDLIQQTTKLALMDHKRYAANARDARTLLRNAVRTVCNLSFESSCRSAFNEISQVLHMLHAITVLPPILADETQDESIPPSAEQQIQSQEQQQEGRMPATQENSTNDATSGFVGTIQLGSLADPDPIWYLLSPRSAHVSSFPWTTNMSEDAKEDALIALLNFAQQPTFANDLLRALDGKLLAAAAEEAGHSRRLRYIYASVLCNLLFDSYLQQLVYGDQAVRALVSGFNFFETWVAMDTNQDEPGTPLSMPTMPPLLDSEKDQFKALNLAFDDDQERFLASIFLIANELMDLTNIELVVMLALPCMKAYLNLATSIPSSAPPSHPRRLQLQRQLPITCYASASLFALTRAATQRRDSQKHLTHSEEAEAMLIAVCALPSGAGGSGPVSGISSSSRVGITQAFCAATLYHLCASTTVNLRVIQGLINCCNVNEESQSLLACSAAFAIISFTAEGCQQLVQCADLARALNRLGRTSQVECQQYAAIAACNVSTVACVWSSAELKDFIVVALLRANSIQAKQIHAKTLSNLLSHGASRPKVVEDGVLYALMRLSQIMMSGTTSASTGTGMTGERRVSGTMDNGVLSSSSPDEVFSIGLRALFNLSCDRQYHHKLLANGVMTYLSTAVECKQPGVTSSLGGASPTWRTPSFNDPAITSFLFGRVRSPSKQHQQLQCLAGHLSVESRRFALAIICNLASYEENHKELMRAQVMEVIRNYVDGDIESRASAAMALRNLSCRQPWVEMLCERKTLQLLILCTECDHPVVRQFAIEALANCSLVTDSLHLFGEMRVPRAVLTLLEVTANGMPPTASLVSVSWELSNDQRKPATVMSMMERESTGTSTYMAALKCLNNIAHDDSLALALMDENVILRLLPLLEYRALGNDAYACELAASLTHTLAGKPKCSEALLRQRTLCETQAVHVVVSICGGGGASTTSANPLGSARNLRLRECGAVTIRNLTLSVTEHLALFYEKHDDGDGSLYDVGIANAEKPVDTMKDLEKEDDVENGDIDRNSSVSLMLERHMLHGIKYFQEEIVSGQASDRILLEASAAIANLSTVKVFRVAMARLGVIQTLLQFMAHPKPKAQRMTLSSPVLTSGSTSPLRLRNTYRNSLLGRICAATLHRLVVEEDAAIDTRSQLIPSLLSVLRQTDEELQQVRYECEKISIFSSNNIIGDAPVASTAPATVGVRRFTHVQTNSAQLPRPGDVLQQALPDAAEKEPATPSEYSLASGLLSPTAEGKRVFGSCGALLPTGAAATQCVRQTYREQKWMVYVLKTILSSQAMIPQLEKKQMRVLGTPKLCFQEDLSPSIAAPPPAPVAASGSTTSRSTSSGPHPDVDATAEGGGRAAAKAGADGFSPSSSGHSDGGATPYEQWRRLRRARTASGNSCASTSSTSSFASYVVNPNTGRRDFGLGSDDEGDDEDEDLDSGVDVEVDDGLEDAREGLPSVLQHIIAPSLPPPPYPVDPYHFYCKPKRTNTGAGTAAAEVTSTLAALFAECGIEAIFHPLKCKFKCLKYVHYSHVEFVVRVYAHQRTLLVEFQRRSGSVLLWDGLYRILHQKLTDIIDATALPCTQSSGQKRVARDSASASSGRSESSNQLTHMSSTTQPQAPDHESLGTQIWRTLSLKKPTPSSGVEAMKIMLTSRYLDAMREGCAGLAELTEDVQNSCLVAKAGLVTPLIQAAEATDLSMSRCAVGALANIARAVPRFPENELALSRRIAQQLRIQAAPVILVQLEQASERSLFSIELLRECARALGAFARLISEVDPRSVAASSVNDERCVHVLRLHAKHRDAQLASHCRAALDQLRLNVYWRTNHHPNAIVVHRLPKNSSLGEVTFEFDDFCKQLGQPNLGMEEDARSDRLWVDGPTSEELEEFERNGDQEWPWGPIPDNVQLVEMSEDDHDFSRLPSMEEIQELQRLARNAADHLALPGSIPLLGQFRNENAWQRFIDGADQDSRWHSSNEGLVQTVDTIGDSLIAELREFGRAAGEDDGVCIWANKLRHQLKSYEDEPRPLMKLADSGRVIEILVAALRTSRGVLNISNRAITTWWFDTFRQERDERIAYYEYLLSDEAVLKAEMGGEIQQLEIMTLLKYGLQKYGEILTPGEERLISSVYDRLVEYSGLVVCEIPDWFTTPQNSYGYWIDSAETPLEEKGEETCLRQASVLSELLHPHVRKMHAACHVGKPFITHAQTRGISTEEGRWRTFYECALGLQYIHERGFIHQSWTDTTLQENVRRDGFVSGLNLVRLRRPEASLGQTVDYPPAPGIDVNAPGSITQTLTADVKAFGLKLFDLLTNNHEINSTRLPESQPSFLSVEEWGLLQLMCEDCQSNRVRMEEVVHAMHTLSKKEEVSQNLTSTNRNDQDEYVNVKNYKYPLAGKRLSVILSDVAEILSEASEFEDVHRIVYLRLEDIYNQLLALPGAVPTSSVKAYCKVMWDLYKQVENQQSLGLSKPVASCASRHVVSSTYTMHQHIDQFLLDIPGISQAAPIHQWKPKWEQYHIQYDAALQERLNTKSEQLGQLENERERLEASVYFEYESRSKPSSCFAGSGTSLPRWFTPRYLVEFCAHIDSGAFASVCHGKLLGADVVIKQLNSVNITATDWQQFRHELDLWFSLNHENLIKLFGACHVGHPFFVCERATGGTLVSALRTNSQLNVWVMLWYAAKGLEHLHDNGIIHGDLKGNNILVCDGDLFERPIAKLADFGLSVLADRKVSNAQGPVGAYRWKAPECLDGASPSVASDIYSFGMCIIEAVSGQFPWGNTISDDVVKRNVVTLRMLPPLPPQLQHNEWNLIQRMCAYDPDERINAGAVVHILLRISQQMQSEGEF